MFFVVLHGTKGMLKLTNLFFDIVGIWFGMTSMLTQCTAEAVTLCRYVC